MSYRHLYFDRIQDGTLQTAWPTCSNDGDGVSAAKVALMEVDFLLSIEPMHALLKSQGGLEKRGMRQALHICRGHFKDYRARGLFGKLKDVLWWDQQLRGDASAGTSVKDYEIDPTKPKHQRGGR